VAAIVVLTEKGRTAGKNGKPWSPLDMRRALKEKLANYKIPQDMKIVEEIPRNAMGKGMFFVQLRIHSKLTHASQQERTGKESLPK
jgi:acyl-CoA synthetase (AMP-forming)/AMP-acid ligase II